MTITRNPVFITRFVQRQPNPHTLGDGDILDGRVCLTTPHSVLGALTLEGEITPSTRTARNTCDAGEAAEIGRSTYTCIFWGVCGMFGGNLDCCFTFPNTWTPNPLTVPERVEVGLALAPRRSQKCQSVRFSEG